MGLLVMVVAYVSAEHFRSGRYVAYKIRKTLMILHLIYLPLYASTK